MLYENRDISIYYMYVYLYFYDTLGEFILVISVMADILTDAYAHSFSEQADFI